MEAVNPIQIGKGRIFRTLSHPDELKALSVMPLMQPRPRGRIIIKDDTLPGETRAKWEADLNRAYGACGCGEASLGLLVGVAGAAVWLGVRVLSGAEFSWQDALWVLLAAAIGQGLGKFAGLVRAQGRLVRLVTDVSQDWKAPPRAHAHGGCG